MPEQRLSHSVTPANAAEFAAQLRQYGYQGPADAAAIAHWLQRQPPDINYAIHPVPPPLKQERERRPGQAEFRRAVLQAYGGRCALTGCNVESALEAAHVPDADWRDQNDAGAGILLRADLHKLLDAGLLVINGDYQVAAVPKWYGKLQGAKLRLPKNRMLWPRLPNR